MTSEEITYTLARCKTDNVVCTVKNKHETDLRFLLPLKMSDTFYMSAVESGMVFDGYLIDRLEAVESVIPSGEASQILLRDSGLLKDISVPQIDLTGPDRIFAYLASMNKPIYAECAEPGNMNVGFFFGYVTGCDAESFSIRCFDANCNWAPSKMTIPYTDLLRLSFGTDVLRTYDAAMNPGSGKKKN